MIATISRTPLSQPSGKPILQPNLVHPYPLQANFTGRVKEREDLTAWLADDEHPIYELVAMGGMGKSALTWYWLTRDVLPSKDAKLDGVMWWSFYEGESSFAKFVDEALKYVSGQPIDVERLASTYDRALELRKLLQDKSVLFVLDGFERQLRAYAGINAAYRPDATTDESSEARAGVEPEATRLLRDVVAGTTHSKLLLTTRLPSSDLQDRAGDPLAGVFERELRELPRDDAIKFMRDQGVTKGRPAEIGNACEAYGYHPLSLRLLSGLIARDAKMPGDIASAPRHDVHDDLVQRQHHVLEQSYDALPNSERALLSRVAAFRSPMTYDALAIFNEHGSEAKFGAELKDLQARGLMQRDTAINRYDLHPIVRHYAYDRLTDKKGVHTRLRDYFSKIPIPEQARAVADLDPVIELFHHCVQAGLHAEALSVFRDRLNQPLYVIGAQYDLCIEVLSALLSVEVPKLSDSNPHDQAWLLNKLALCYNRVGRSHDAEVAFRDQIRIREEMDYLPGVAIGLGNLSEVLIRLGRLREATDILERKIKLSKHIRDSFKEMAGRQDYGLVLAYQGEFEESAKQLKTTFDWLSQRGRSRYESVSWAFDTISKVIHGRFEEALQSAEHGDQLAAVEGRERDTVRAKWLLGLTKILATTSLSNAASLLQTALADCRRINLVELEPDILLAWGRWHRAKDDGQEALTQVQTALAIADRCEYRLKQADIHNFLARLAMDAGDRETARKEAEIAKERAWCDGPPYCYKPALDEAEKMLEELGAKE